MAAECGLCRGHILDNQHYIHYTCDHREHLYCHDVRRNSQTAGCTLCLHETPERAEARVLAVYADSRAHLLDQSWNVWRERRESGAPVWLGNVVDSAAIGDGNVGNRPPYECITVSPESLGKSVSPAARIGNAQFTHASERQRALLEFLELCKGTVVDAECILEGGFTYMDLKDLVMGAKDADQSFSLWKHTTGLNALDMIELGATWEDLLKCGIDAVLANSSTIRPRFYINPPLSVRYETILVDLCKNSWAVFFKIHYTAKELCALGATAEEIIPLEKGPAIVDFAHLRYLSTSELVNVWGLTRERLRSLYVARGESVGINSEDDFMYRFCINTMRWSKSDCLKHLNLTMHMRGRKS